ncbi:Ribokinase-like protein [Obba rivulosa]|uniref:pyridoxal kinase n=1 Tax=Obba rivulosa TaxID=1052685 RepID=A0A8E2DK85_9APHY|nr:Ribokinase-like protein [Obba rivulosa]
MPSEGRGRVLSIQSHVSFGYVGGKAAVFPLQCLGYDVDVINTVNLSNHTGYGRWGGTRATAAELDGIFESMEQNGLLLPDRLLTGYIPGAEALSAVMSVAKKLRERNPDLLYLLDPVMGDSGKLYVAPDVVPIYRTALQYATIITPNWFEVEVLTDVKIVDMPSLRRAIQILHDECRVPNVVISSIPLRDWLRDALPSHMQPPPSDLDHLVCICSSVPERGEGTPHPSAVHAQHIPCLPGYFSGVGDLFSALVLAHYAPAAPTPHPDVAPSPLASAVSQALTKTHAILALTHTFATTLPEEERLPTDEEADAREPDRRIRRMRGRELRLIQGQDIIRGEEPVDCRRMEPWVDFWS